MKNKFLISAIAAAALLTSCKTQMYQIYTVESDDVKVADTYMVHSTDDIDILFNMWADEGDFSFVINNNTDKVIYVDLSKSYFICNGFSKDYFLNRQWESSRTSTSGSGASASLGVRGRLTNGYSNYPAQMGVGAYGYDSYSRQEGVTTVERSELSIPPKSFKMVSGYPIATVIANSSKFSATKEGSQKYEKFSSPYQFSNYITYHVDGDKEKSVRSEFWVSSIENVKEKNEVKQERRAENPWVITKIFRDLAPNKFYQLYKVQH